MVKYSTKPIVLLTGMRRIGKTSVLKVFLKESGLPYALIDIREPVRSYRSLYSKFSNALTQLNKSSSLASMLKHVKGVSMLGFEVSLSWAPEEMAVEEIFDKLNQLGRRFLIAIDEAQNFRGILGEKEAKSDI